MTRFIPRIFGGTILLASLAPTPKTSILTMRLSVRVQQSPSLPMRLCLSPFYPDGIIFVPSYLRRSF